MLNIFFYCLHMSIKLYLITYKLKAIETKMLPYCYFTYFLTTLSYYSY